LFVLRMADSVFRVLKRTPEKSAGRFEQTCGDLREMGFGPTRFKGSVLAELGHSAFKLSHS